MIKPLTDILKPGPISSGKLANKALRATLLDLMDERREFSSVIPVPVEDGLAVPTIDPEAPGSIGEVR